MLWYKLNITNFKAIDLSMKPTSGLKIKPSSDHIGQDHEVRPTRKMADQECDRSGVWMAKIVIGQNSRELRV